MAHNSVNKTINKLRSGTRQAGKLSLTELLEPCSNWLEKPDQVSTRIQERSARGECQPLVKGDNFRVRIRAVLNIITRIGSCNFPAEFYAVARLASNRYLIFNFTRWLIRVTWFGFNYNRVPSVSRSTFCNDFLDQVSNSFFERFSSTRKLTPDEQN